MNKNLRKRLNRIIIAGMMVTSSVMPIFAETINVTSKPSYTHKQFVGKTRYETGVLTAKEANKKNIIVVNGATEKMVDGLCASALVDKFDATVLPIDPNKVNSDAKKIIDNAENVYVIGLESAIPESFVKTIPSSVKVTRIGGNDRFETSKEIAKYLGSYDKAFLVNGLTGQADAMSMASVSAKYKAPILLTKKSSTIFDKKENIKYFVIGGTNAISNSLEAEFGGYRIAGATRYETNRQVLKTFYSKSTTRYFTNGETLIDALSGASLSKYNGITFVNKNKNLDLLKDMDTIQIGGLPFKLEFTDKEDTNKPDNNVEKPENNKPSKPNDDSNDDGIFDGVIDHNGEENEEINGEMSDDDTQVGEM